jgi:cytochrome P450
MLAEAPASPAGPADDADQTLPPPPVIPVARPLQVLRFSVRQIQFVFHARRKLGDVFAMNGLTHGEPVITCHPDHARSLFTAKAELVPSLAGESALRPVVGPNSTLTALGERHMRQRKMLLPAFHGDAVERYAQMISDVTEAAIDRWPKGKPFALAPRMQAITLDVIMAGIFGIEGRPRPGTPEHVMRTAIRSLLAASTWPLAQVAELMNIGREDPVGMTKVGIGAVDVPVYAVIRARRKAADLDERRDIMSMLMRARSDEGEALTDQEIRDELLTLVLAGHETTANSLAWIWERLVRSPQAYERLRAAARDGNGDAGDVIEETIVEGMRVRPVVPIIGRRVMVPWRLGDYCVPGGTGVTISVLLLHHREDLYPDPFAFRPERWTGRKPGTYEWIPFGGGIRRCLGAALAMAEQRVVLRAMAERLDLRAAEPEAERAIHRNVTMIPSRGGRVVAR